MAFDEKEHAKEKVSEFLNKQEWFLSLKKKFKPKERSQDFYYFDENSSSQSSKSKIDLKPKFGDWKETVLYYIRYFFTKTYKFQKLSGKTSTDKETGLIKANSEKEILDNIEKYYKIDKDEIIAYELFHGESTFDNLLADPLYLFKRIKDKDILNFTLKMETMMTSGHRLNEAMKLTIRGTKNKSFKSILSSVYTMLLQGVTLDKALAKYPYVFNNFYISMVQTGLDTSKIGEMFGKIAETIEKSMNIKHKIQKALIMPSIMLILILAIFYFLVTRLIPALTSLYNDFDKELPGIAQNLLTLSESLTDFWYIYLVALVGIIIILKLIFDFKEVKEIKDSLILKVPIFGRMVQLKEQAQFLRLLGTIISGGGNLKDACEIAWGATKNTLYRKAISLFAVVVTERGGTITMALNNGNNRIQDGVFDIEVISLIEASEESGALGDVLITQANSLERELDKLSEKLGTYIEPVIIIVMGGLVGMILYLFFSILFNPELFQLDS